MINEKEIKKPITMVINETRNAIVSIISGSGLPIWVIEPMMKSLTMDLTNTLLTLEINERLQYEKELQEQKNEINKQKESANM